MCGIAGILKSGEKKIEESQLSAMSRALRQRGPDDQGIFLAPGVGLVSTRLAILDLSPSGHMPMQTPDGRFTIVHNGEIYNYRDFYPYLKSKGWKFKSHSDTEVLLYLFAQDGPAMLEQLNGMFAFAVWDTKEKKLFAARDRLGVKPFYYSVRGRDFYFASEEKALFAADVPKKLNEAVIPELIFFRYVSGETTPFRGISRLLPGHFIIWKEGDLQIRRWWNFQEKILQRRSEGVRKAEEWFHETFDSSVHLRKISDVPVGVLLSGGLDSSSLVAAVSLRQDTQTHSFTIGFEENGYDERSLARITAKKFNLKNHELTIKKESLPGLLDSAIDYHDEPPAHASDLHVLAISKYAKQYVSVLLSGEGGDEILGGYNRYFFLRQKMLAAALGFLVPVWGFFKKNSKAGKIAGLAALAAKRKVLFCASEVFPREIPSMDQAFSWREKIVEQAEAIYPGDEARQAMYYDQHTYLCSLLDRNDRMTMAASIECRTPFLDYRLVEGSAAMPTNIIFGGKPKSLLRKSVGHRLPRRVLNGRKWGLGVPWGLYLRTVPEWRSEVDGLCRSGFVKAAELDEKWVSRWTADFKSGDNSRDALIYQLFILSKWHAKNKL